MNDNTTIQGVLNGMRAQQYPIKDHPISSCSEYERGLYYDMLCMLAQYKNNDPTAEIGFIQRIMAGCGDCGDNEHITDHIARSMKFTSENIGDVITMIKNHRLEEVFLVDALILVSMQGSPDRDRARLVAGLSEMLITDKNKIGFMCRLAKSIVEQDFTPIYEKDVSHYIWGDLCKELSCYVWDKNLWSTVKNVFYYSAEIQHSLVFNRAVTIEDKDYVCIENQYIDHNVNFKNIRSIYISGCNVRSNIGFIDVDKIDIVDSSFDNISGPLFSFKHPADTKIYYNNCQFTDIHSTPHQKGAVILGEALYLESTFINCVFKNIQSKSWDTSLIHDLFGEMPLFKQCSFIDCLGSPLIGSYFRDKQGFLNSNNINNCSKISQI